MNGEIEDETHFVMECSVYEDLREKMLDAASSTLAEKGINSAEARKDEEGRRKS